MIRNHGGAISAENRPEGGALFRLWLPLSVHQQPPVPTPATTEIVATPKPPRVRILLVEDEEPVARILALHLTRSGFSTETFNDPLQALAHFEAQPDAYDLLLTDLGMPNLSGDALATRIRAIRSDLPVIVCTGYGIHTDITLPPGTVTVTKPVLDKELITAVRTALKT